MRKNFLFKSFLIFFSFIVSFSIFSCNTTKKTKYFQDIPDSGKLKTIGKVEYKELRIQEDDMLTVIVQTIDPAVWQTIGNSGSATSTPPVTATSLPKASQPGAFDYLVDKAGFIELPGVGKVKVTGLTTSEAREVIRTAATKQYNNLQGVIVRFANFKVNVTGEVLRPGQYVMPNEKVTIIDAIAMAGDLTIFGKRDNVLLVRENADGTKTPYRIDLTKSDVMTAPYYYLKQNDYIYVEPRKAKSDANDASQTKYITIAGSLLSILIILATRLK